MNDNNALLPDMSTPTMASASMKVRMKFGIIGACICLLLGLFFGVIFLGTNIESLLPSWFDEHEILEVFFFPLHIALLSLMGSKGGNLTPLVIASSIGAALSLIMYFVIGYVIGLMHEKIRDRISGKVAVVVTLVIVFIIPISLIYGKYRQHKDYFHVGATPSDCAKLKSEEQNWCYRNIYRLNSVPEVCIHLDGGEEEECGRRYGAQSGSLVSCSVFSKKELVNNCKWGVAFARRDVSLCNELPDDDSTPYNPSTQKSCIDVITNYWENNKDFYFNPEKDMANKKAAYNNQ